MPGGEGIENPSKDDALENGSLGYLVSIHIGSLGTTNSDCTLEGGTRPFRDAPGGPMIGPEGVEKVSIVDVDGEGPLGGMEPKAGSGGTAGEGVRLSVIGESCVQRIDSTTDSG